MKDDKTLLKSFYNFMEDTEGLSEEDIVSALDDYDIDVPNLKLRVAKVVKKGSEKRRMAWRETAQKERTRIGKLLNSKGIPMATNLKDKINGILAGNFGHQASEYAEAYFRKKGTLTEKDMESLIEDLEDLDILAEPEEKE